MTITRGRTFTAQNTLKNSSGVATAPAVSSEVRFIAKWKATDDDTQTVFTCSTVSNDGITFSGGTGVFTLTISAGKTSTLPATTERMVLSYELIYIVSPDVYTLDAGRLYIEPAVLQTV